MQYNAKIVVSHVIIMIVGAVVIAGICAGYMLVV